MLDVVPGAVLWMHLAGVTRGVDSACTLLNKDLERSIWVTVMVDVEILEFEHDHVMRSLFGRVRLSRGRAEICPRPLLRRTQLECVFQKP